MPKGAAIPVGCGGRQLARIRSFLHVGKESLDQFIVADPLACLVRCSQVRESLLHPSGGRQGVDQVAIDPFAEVALGSRIPPLEQEMAVSSIYSHF